MKRIKNYLLTALLAFTLAFGITGITTLTKASAETKLSANLNVGQDISLVISADIPNAGEVMATFAWSGEKAYSDTVVGEKQGETNVYKFFYRGLSAQYMAKEVAVTVYSGETEVANTTVSVKGILDTYLNSSAKDLKINANAYKKLTTLSADILNYGKAAEKHLNMPDDIGEVTGGTTFVADEAATSKAQGNLKWNAGITFDYNLRPAVKVYIPTDVYKATLVAKIDGNVATLTATDTANVYTLTYSNYNILDIDNDYKFEIFDEDGTTSLGSYTSSLAALAKESNAEIVKAAYVYGKSVVKYAFVLENIDFVSEHFQAEDVITGGGSKRTGINNWQYTAADGTITDGNDYIANGAEGQFVDNLSKNAAWVAKILVNVPKTGEYDLRSMMHVNNNISLSRKFKIAVKQSDEEPSDTDYVVSTTTDRCFPAFQWDDDGYSNGGNGWKNYYFWTEASLGTYSLIAGENVIYIASSAASTDNIPNIDYFYVKGFTTREDAITVVNTREAFKTSLANQVAIGTTEESAFVVQKGAELKELFKYSGGYVNNMTGLYMIIPEYNYGVVQPFKVPVTENMISGLNVDEAGMQKATVTYKTYSTEVYFNVYESVIEAEDNVFMLVDGAESETKYTKVESSTQAEYYNEGSTSASSSYAYNGFSGRGMVTNLGSNYSSVYFKFNVEAPIAGNYYLKVRAQYINNDTSVQNRFSFSVNGQEFTKNSKAQTIYKGNQMSSYVNTNSKTYKGYYNMFWWTVVDLGTLTLNKGSNEIRVYMPSKVDANIDRFEVVYDDTTTSSVIAKTSIFSMRTKGVEESLDGKVLTIKKGVKLTDIIPVNALHPATYTSLYMRLTSGKEVPILGSMLDGKVDYNKVGVEQLVTVTDPVSKESASFTLLIKA